LAGGDGEEKRNNEVNDKQKILVTGGAGYIGSHVVQQLCDDSWEVVILDNFSTGRRENVDRRAEVVEGDILNSEDLDLALADNIGVVFHFAAWKAAGESMVDPGKYAWNNICGTVNLLNSMLRHKVSRFIFSSSAAVYGTPQYLPADEAHPVDPTNYYGYTKLAIEQNLRWYSQLMGLRYAALRYFNATGYDLSGRIKGRETNPANLSPVIMEVAAGERDKVQIFGTDYDTRDGTGVRDYIHVVDLVTAHVAAMDYICVKEEDLVINLGTGIGHSVLDMIAAAEKATGKPIPYEVRPRREGDPAELIASCDLAGKLLGWKARHSDLDTIFKSMCHVYL
jgi:UDP-glucose 4-epimerase